MQPEPVPPSPWAPLWGLDPDVVYLNHGAYGVCPLAVRRIQDDWRDRARRQPHHHYGFERPRLLAEARAALAAFVGADVEDLAFVPRATTGVNAVLRALRFDAGDELLTTSHAFHATAAAMEEVAAAAGAHVVVAAVPFPIAAPEEATAAVVARMTGRTRLVVVDAIASQTALVFPVAAIVREATARGIDVLVDGAHAAGQVPLDIEALGAAYFVGNTHKWMGTPPSAGFVHVRRDRRDRLALDPGRPLARAFDWTMSHDPTPFLCIPAAIAHVGGMLAGGWPALMAHNHALVVAARERLCAALGVGPPCPAEMVASMAVVPLPPRGPESEPAPWLDPLQTALLERHRIVAPIMAGPAPHRRLLRVAAQLYNSPAQYEALARALFALLRG